MQKFMVTYYSGSYVQAIIVNAKDLQDLVNTALPAISGDVATALPAISGDVARNIVRIERLP